MQNLENSNQKTAFIAIVGKPNVGKSSILNKLLGQKIAIVSSKPQTTRTRIMGVLTQEDTQLVFIDTPGMHKPKTHLGDYMVRTVNQSLVGVDACMLVVEATKEISEIEELLMDKIVKNNIPAILAINKIDLIKNKEDLIKDIEKYSAKCDFQAIIPVSATNDSGLDILNNELKKLAESGEHFFEEDTLTDQPERVLAGEIIREKILRLMNKEIPHGTAVVIEKMKTREDSGIVDIEATIYCEKESHKGIIIGKKGAMLKRVGTYAREDMEKFFDCKIHLVLWVKVKEDWRNKDGILRSLGYDKNNFD